MMWVHVIGDGLLALIASVFVASALLVCWIGICEERERRSVFYDEAANYRPCLHGDKNCPCGLRDPRHVKKWY